VPLGLIIADNWCKTAAQNQAIAERSTLLHPTITCPTTADRLTIDAAKEVMVSFYASHNGTVY
jgi:hypothetical protein